MISLIRAVWRYRVFIASSITNELRVRFSRSILGGLWLILNPLVQVSIYALILSNLLSAKLPQIDSKYGYAVFLIAGLVGWTFFNEIISRTVNVFVENANLMKKMSFPRITLPLIVAGSCALNYVCLLLAAFVIFTIIGHGLNFTMLAWIPLLFFITAGLAMGLGLLLAIFNVFTRDIGLAAPIVLQIWFWLTPIVYPLAIIPEAYHAWFNYNPLYHLVRAYQVVLLEGVTPDYESLLILAGLSVALFIIALVLFRASSEDVVDAL